MTNFLRSTWSWSFRFYINLKNIPDTWLKVGGTFSVRLEPPWRASAFVPLLTSSPLIKIGIIHTQEKMIFPYDTQIRAIGPTVPEICTKMLRNWREKLRTTENFLALHVATPWKKIAPLGKKRNLHKIKVVVFWISHMWCYDAYFVTNYVIMTSCNSTPFYPIEMGFSL